MSSESEINFHHFDQECDFGIETATGEWVRKKKRPGRKPNPPTAEKKRAQNRASQKAYRQRKNEKQEKDAKLKQEHAREVKELKRRLMQSEYEANYLRAIVLHLTMTHIVARGSVPHAWTADTKDSKVPALLDIFLENNHIMELNKAQQSAFFPDVVSLCNSKLSPPQSYDDFSKQYYRTPDLSPQEVQDFSEPESPESDHAIQYDTEHGVQYKNGYITQNRDEHATQNESKHSAPNEGDLNREKQLTIHKKPVRGVLLHTPEPKTAEDYINMTPLQALHISRLQLKMNSVIGPCVSLSLKPCKYRHVYKYPPSFSQYIYTT